jgi:hypothetical protein
MKLARLTVLIHRQGKTESAPGILRAHVIQGNLQGSNLLAGRQYSKLESAKTRCRDILRQDCGEIEIEWKIEEAAP